MAQTDLFDVDRRLPKRSPRSSVVRAECAAVVAHYLTYHPRSKPGKMERGKIRARLAEGYSVADLIAAIDGCHRSAFHCGENDRGKTYQTLDLIMRNGSMVQQFIEVPPHETVLNEKERRTLRAGDQWLQRTEDTG